MYDVPNQYYIYYASAYDRKYTIHHHYISLHQRRREREEYGEMWNVVCTLWGTGVYVVFGCYHSSSTVKDAFLAVAVVAVGIESIPIRTTRKPIFCFYCCSPISPTLYIKDNAIITMYTVCGSCRRRRTLNKYDATALVCKLF